MPVVGYVRLENTFVGVEGIGETLERRLWAAGVTHWDDFDRSVLGPTRADRIEAFLGNARGRLAAGDARFFERTLPSSERWRLYENFRDEAVYLDIETTGLSHHHDVTTVSLHRDGRTTTLVRGRDLTVDRLREALAPASLLITFNGAQFDLPFLESSFNLTIDTPHVDLRYPCGQLGLSGGLTAIERTIGLERDRPDISGDDAVRLWHAYDRDGNEAALETLVAYNREDTANLRPLMEHVAERLHERIFLTGQEGLHPA